MRPPASIARLATLAAAITAVAGGAPAAAQEAVVEGPGYELTEGTVLHPSVGIETGVISNVFYEATGGRAAPVLRLRGGLTIASQQSEPAGEKTLLVDPDEVGDTADEGAAPSLDFRLSGYLVREQYLGADESTLGGFQLSRQNNFHGGLDVYLMTMPEGTVSLFVDDRLARITGPRSYESAGTLHRVINRLRTGARVRPGNGALEIRAQYENTLDVFESSASTFANRIQHLLRAQAAWRFLPVTRFFFDASIGYFGALGNVAASVGGCATGGLQKCRSKPLRVRLGAASALTGRTTARAHVGFGKGFYEAREDFTNVLLGAELGRRYSPRGRFTVAYEYGFQDSVQANFYRDHAVAVRLDQQIDLVLIKAGLDLRLRGYRGISPALGPPSRDDVILRAFAKGHYLYRDWLAFTAELDIVSDQSDYRYMSAVYADPGYQRLLFQLGAVAAF